MIYIPDKDNITDTVCEMLQPDDLVITLGAGDIWRTGKSIVEKLEAGA